MSIVIGADFVPTSKNLALFNEGKVTELVGEKLEKIIKDADFRIFNLEMPLADMDTPIKKAGPVLRAPTQSINAYKALNVNLVTIGNNHLMDQGRKGYRSTIETLDKVGIEYIGVGEDLYSQKHSTIFEVKGKKVGVYACAEHEFSIATEDSCGVNPYDPLESFDHVADLKSKCDFVIVLYHGGRENYRYPTPNLRKVFRKFADKGADLVLGQHSHCICCEEKYNGKTLVYGQGNFVFDYGEDEFSATSLLVRIDDDFNVEYLPIRKTGKTIKLAEKKKGEDIISAFNLRSEQIKDKGFIERKFIEHSEDKALYSLLVVSGTKYTFVRKVLNRLTKKKYMKSKLAKRYKGDKKLALLNMIKCQAHNEVLQQIIENMRETER